MGEKNYLLLDGNALTQIVRDLAKTHFGNRPLELDFSALREELSKELFMNGGEYSKVFYYDALPTRKRDKKNQYCEDEADFEVRRDLKKASLNQVLEIDYYHVRTGEVRRKQDLSNNEQKMVDVQLAVDALSWAYKGVMQHCSLLTRDLDFKPLLETLVDTGIDVALWHDAQAPKELVRSADRARNLSTALLYRCLTEESKSKNPVPEFGSTGFFLEDLSNLCVSGWRQPDGHFYVLVKSTPTVFVLERGTSPQEGRVESITIRDINSARTLLADPGFMLGRPLIQLPDESTWDDTNRPRHCGW